MGEIRSQSAVTLTVSGHCNVVIGPHTRDVVTAGSSVLLLVDLQRFTGRLEQTLFSVLCVPELHFTAGVPAGRISFCLKEPSLCPDTEVSTLLSDKLPMCLNKQTVFAG